MPTDTTAPPAPRAEILPDPVTVGLQPLLEDLTDVIGGPLDGPTSQRLVDLVGDRYSVTVSSNEVVSRGLIRRHRVEWVDAEAVVVEPMAAMATRRLIGRTTRSLVGRGLPIPGVRWAARALVDRVADVAADVTGSLPLGLPPVLVEVRPRSDRGRGGGVTLEGPLALTALLSRALTEAAIDRAREHGVPVEVTD